MLFLASVEPSSSSSTHYIITSPFSAFARTFNRYDFDAFEIQGKKEIKSLLLMLNPVVRSASITAFENVSRTLKNELSVL